MPRTTSPWFNERAQLLMKLCQIYHQASEGLEKCKNSMHRSQNNQIYNPLYYSKNKLLSDSKRKLYINGWCRHCLKDLLNTWNDEAIYEIIKGGFIHD